MTETPDPKQSTSPRPRACRLGGARASAARALLLVVCAGLGACVRVAPYERETLARPDMALAKSPDVWAGEEHAHAYREGSSGGGDAKGGGCGCN